MWTWVTYSVYLYLLWAQLVLFSCFLFYFEIVPSCVASCFSVPPAGVFLFLFPHLYLITSLVCVCVCVCVCSLCSPSCLFQSCLPQQCLLHRVSSTLVCFWFLFLEFSFAFVWSLFNLSWWYFVFCPFVSLFGLPALGLGFHVSVYQLLFDKARPQFLNPVSREWSAVGSSPCLPFYNNIAMNNKLYFSSVCPQQFNHLRNFCMAFLPRAKMRELMWYL